MRKHLTAPISIAPLAVFRVLFGLIMAVSILRFALMGWIGELYVQPTYHFTFYGFDWVQPLGAVGMHVLFAAMGLATVGVMLGWHYRMSATAFFLLFTYVELIDKANYLNHYYFVSIVAGMLIFLPAHRAFSLDVRRRPDLRADTVPAWTVNALKLQLGIVYVFAGLAKLHPDWLIEAMPLQLWLPAHAHLPIVGPLLAEVETAYLFSWAGALYDLAVPFFLLWGRTRVLAYVAVVGFHLTTAALFPIGMFPYIMIACTLVFFSPRFHERVIARAKTFGRALVGRTRATVEAVKSPIHFRFGQRASVALGVLFAVHFALQLVLPLRAAVYPGDLFWTEQGYRFSWRVMLMEKAGYAVFHVRDPKTGRSWEVSNYEHLTPNQEKMMATQPDMILQFAHHLEDEYRRQGLDDVEITVRAHVTLNGRPSRLLVDPEVDLTEIEPGLGHKAWVLPFDDTEHRWVSRQR